jgi:hypothetical protein
MSLTVRARLDLVAQRREVLLESERQPLVAHAKRDLDELEVVEIRVPGGDVGRLRVPNVVLLDRQVDELP